MSAVIHVLELGVPSGPVTSRWQVGGGREASLIPERRRGLDALEEVGVLLIVDACHGGGVDDRAFYFLCLCDLPAASIECKFKSSIIRLFYSEPVLKVIGAEFKCAFSIQWLLPRERSRCFAIVIDPQLHVVLGDCNFSNSAWFPWPPVPNM